jgi:hypothetical protein
MTSGCSAVTSAASCAEADVAAAKKCGESNAWNFRSDQLWNKRQLQLHEPTAMTRQIIAMDRENLLPLSAQTTSNNQRLFVRYFTGILIDLLVLNLFDEYSDRVFIHSFTTSLLAAILLQVLLKLTLAVEHQVAIYFNARPGRLMVFCRYFFAWVVVFLSKFVILEALAFVFGEDVRFEGMFHGLLTLIVVVVAMLIAEEAIVRLYRRLGDQTD